MPARRGGRAAVGAGTVLPHPLRRDRAAGASDEDRRRRRSRPPARLRRPRPEPLRTPSSTRPRGGRGHRKTL